MDALRAAVSTIFLVLRLLLIAKVLTSWVPYYNRKGPVYKFIDMATDPLLEPFKRLIPVMGGFDFSPVIVFLILRFLEDIIVRGLFV